MSVTGLVYGSAVTWKMANQSVGSEPGGNWMRSPIKRGYQGISSRDDEGPEQQPWQGAKAVGISRRTFLALLSTGGAATVFAACGKRPQPAPAAMPTPPAVEVAHVRLPPADVKVFPTAYDYCVVGDGYKAIVWPVRPYRKSHSEGCVFVHHPTL